MTPGATRRTLAALILAAVAVPALAVHPGRWVHTTEADFAPGQKDKTVVTNLGDVKLAVGTTPIGKVPDNAAVILDMQQVKNGDIYLAAGPEGRLLRRHGDQITEVFALTGEQIFALDVDAQGRLVMAISGDKSRLAVLENDKPRTLCEIPGVRYIWDMLVEGNKFVLATGTEGKLLLVDPAQVLAGVAARGPAQTAPAEEAEKHNDQAQPATAPATATAPADDGDAPVAVKVKPIPGITVLLDASQTNLLCLAKDIKGGIYVGTDTDGLIYRVTRKPDGTPEAFVVFDAPEPEIGALLVMPNGMVYAGTADAEQAKPGRLSEAAATEAGRPGGAAEAAPAGQPGGAEPAPGQPGEEPKPPEPGDLPQVPPQPGPIGDQKPDKKSADPAAKDDDTAPPANDSEETAPAKKISLPDHAALPLAEKGEKGEKQPAAAPNAPAKAPPADAEPTAEQHDALREVIRQRLEQARKTGALLAGPPRMQRTPRRAAGPTAPPPSPVPGGAAQTSKEGNAVYRISPNGFVTEVFRESVMILKLLNDDGRLLVATGNEGELYRVDTEAQETTILADLEPQQIPAIIRAADGRIYLGTANPAQLVELDQNFAAEGTYTSSVLDATQISLWGKLNITASVPDQTTISVQTRSGNVQDPDKAAWSPWSEAEIIKPDPNVGALSPRELTVSSPPARFFQYRLTLKGNGKTTAVADKIDTAYIVPNLKPNITSITVTSPEVGGTPSGGTARPGAAAASAAAQAGGEPQPQPNFNITWEATDPNNDSLRYTLEYQAAGSSKWLPLAKDLTETNHEWDTRRVPDGRYTVRVTAADAPDNPKDMARTASRISDPILVDNTPPTLAGLKVAVENRVVTISGEAKDNLAPIAAIHYAVDGTDEYQSVLPTDMIFDSTHEPFVIKISDLAAGSHVITMRTSDTRGNASYQAMTVEIK